MSLWTLGQGLPGLSGRRQVHTTFVVSVFPSWPSPQHRVLGMHRSRRMAEGFLEGMALEKWKLLSVNRGGGGYSIQGALCS